MCLCVCARVCERTVKLGGCKVPHRVPDQRFMPTFEPPATTEDVGEPTRGECLLTDCMHVWVCLQECECECVCVFCPCPPSVLSSLNDLYSLYRPFSVTAGHSQPASLGTKLSKTKQQPPGSECQRWEWSRRHTSSPSSPSPPPSSSSLLSSPSSVQPSWKEQISWT